MAGEVINAHRTAVTQIEAGRREGSTLDLSQLAVLYGRPVSWFFSETADQEEDVLVALQRAAPGLERHPETAREIDRCIGLCREGVTLERLLGRITRSILPNYGEPVPGSPWDAIAQGQRIAEQERRRLGLGTAPVADMAEFLVGQGVWASGTNLPGSMSGLFLSHPSIGLAVLINAGHARARKRFSYAHEFAHALLDRDRTVTVSSADNAGELVEKRANALAAAFLMPRDGVAEQLKALDKGEPSRLDQTIFDAATGGRIDAQHRQAASAQDITYQDAAFIAHHFGVSYQAATYRLRSLRHVSQAECEALLAREPLGREYLQLLDMNELDEPEAPSKRDHEMRNQVAHLALEAYRREEISRGRLLDLSKALGVSGTRLLSLADAALSA
jgi:Zn-dependent peptidase ImmA (M78 family)